MNKDLEKIIFEVKKGSNRAFCELIKYCIENKKYNLIFSYMDDFIETENKIYKNDYNLYLFLLSMITSVPNKYNAYIKSLSLEDIQVPLKNTKDENIILENDVRTLIYNHKFITASRRIYKVKALYNERIFIVDYLLKEIVKIQSRERKNVLELIKTKKYKDIVLYLREREKNNNLSLNDRYVLLLSETIIEMLEKNIIPKRMKTNSNAIFPLIDAKNYRAALSSSEVYSKKKYIALEENEIYLLLNDICNIISKIERENKNGNVDINTIIFNLKNKNHLKALNVLNKYLKLNNKEKYSFLIVNLIKISVLKGDNSFEEPIKVLNDIVNNNYEFDINEYVYMYQNALLNNENELAILYLDILNKSHLLVENQGKIDIDRESSSSNIINYNKDYDFVCDKLLELKNGKNLVIIDNIEHDKIQTIMEIVSDIPNIIAFDIAGEENTKIIIRRKFEKEDNISKEDIIYKAKLSYQRKKYDDAINYYFMLFTNGKVSPWIYAKIGFCYIGMGNNNAATMYLKVASYLEKNEDRKKEYVEIVDKLEREIKTFLPVADRIIDIDNNYGIDNIEEIVNLIFQYDMTVEDVCYSMGLDEEKKNLAILLIARESYYQERYKLGDFYIKKISKIKNRSIIVDRLYKVVLRERNFYKNRDDSNHKKLVLYKEG